MVQTLERMLAPHAVDAAGIERLAGSRLWSLIWWMICDGHILGVATIAAVTGRMDLGVARLFGAGKSRAAAVMLVGMLIANPAIR